MSILPSALLWPALAACADLPSYEQTAPPARAPAAVTPPGYDPNRFEARFGAFTHGVGSVESWTADLNGEFVAPRLPFWQDQWFNFVVPRPHIGGLYNLNGRTSAAYAGLLWSVPLPYRFFGETFFDGAVHNGELNNIVPGHAQLGCRALFHVGGSLGYSVTPHWNVMATFAHLSNGNSVFGTDCLKNQGLNSCGAQIGYSF